MKFLRYTEIQSMLKNKINSLSHGIQTAQGVGSVLQTDALNLAGYLLSEKYVENMRNRSPISLIMNIDYDFDMCRPTAYAYENDTSCDTGFSDAVIGGNVKPQGWEPTDEYKVFHGYRMMSKLVRIHKDKFECMQQDDFVMRQWLRDSDRNIEQAIEQIKAEFLNFLLAKGIHHDNQGNEAGLIRHDAQLGLITMPLRGSADNMDNIIMEMLKVQRQMPKNNMPLTPYGDPTDNMFFWSDSSLESVLMKTPAYNSWQLIGDCAGCSMFDTTFSKKPRGMMPIGSDCIPATICKSAGKDRRVVPILFGTRNMGINAAIKVETSTYPSEDGKWLNFLTEIKYNINSYDCRYLGKAYIAIEDEAPEMLGACA